MTAAVTEMLLQLSGQHPAAESANKTKAQLTHISTAHSHTCYVSKQCLLSGSPALSF